jgi:hypothetical protein
VFPVIQIELLPGIIELGWGHPPLDLLPVAAMQRAAIWSLMIGNRLRYPGLGASQAVNYSQFIIHFVTQSPFHLATLSTTGFSSPTAPLYTGQALAASHHIPL